MKKLLALAGIALLQQPAPIMMNRYKNADRLISLWKTPLLLKSK